MHNLETLAFSVPELAEAARVSERHIWALIASGRGPKTTRIGRRTIVTRPNALTWLDSLTETESAA